MLQRGVRDRLARQHARHLRDALAPLERRGPTATVPSRDLRFLRLEVPVRRARDLRHVRHAEDLVLPAASARSFWPTTSATRPPMPASTSSKTSVRPRRPRPAETVRIASWSPRELAARGDPLERLLRLARVAARSRNCRGLEPGAARRVRRQGLEARRAAAPSPGRGPGAPSRPRPRAGRGLAAPDESAAAAAA